MRENILVTVAIPSYNHEKYIEEAVRSVFKSLHKNIEIIAIDDGSTDNSPQILERLSREFNFKFISRENRGLTRTLNEALSLSNGKYFFHIGSDDTIEPLKISDCIEHMEKNSEYGLCYGRMFKLIEDKNILTEQKVRKIRRGWVFDELLKHDFIPLISYFAKTDVLKEVGGFDENMWLEDWDMWLRVAEKYQIGYLDKPLGTWRIHETNNSKKLLKMVEAEDLTMKKWENHKSYKEARIYREIYWFNLLAQSHQKEALKYLPTALKHPFRSRSLKGFWKISKNMILGGN